MKKKIICSSIAIATMLFALFLWWLSGSAFERSNEFALFVYFFAYIFPFWDDEEKK